MKNNYRKLKWELMLRTLLVTALALGIGYVIVELLVDGLLQNGFPDLVIHLLMFFDLSYDEANTLYGTVFMDHTPVSGRGLYDPVSRFFLCGDLKGDPLSG